MFCYQCEQTAKGSGCNNFGVCGKDPDTATLQDLLVYAARGVAMYANRARELGFKDHEIDVFIIEALFSTVTNVNFDPERLRQILLKAAELKQRAKALYEQAAAKAGKQAAELDGPAQWVPAADLAGLISQGETLSILKERESQGDDITGLRYLIFSGLKGMAAYADHALILGVEDEAVFAFFHQALDFLSKKEFTVDELLGMALKSVRSTLESWRCWIRLIPVLTAIRCRPRSELLQ